MNFEELFAQNKEINLFGRYITLDDIEPILKKWNTKNQLTIEGYSVLKKPIYSYQIGEGEIRIMMWSQMHGNESTTTKALFDLLSLLHNKSELAKDLLSKFTFFCLPMLNPDGAKVYTRENANQIDLNRDAQNLSQPESKILRACFDKFKPNYCYNLHDQRTIFGAGNTGKPATISFLSPSYNESCDYNESRIKALNVIATMNDELQKHVPNQIGRFDDAFNLNCVGDTFQSLNVPTILFEAGHYQNDYNREFSRKFIFFALLSSFKHFYENDIVDNRIDDYLNIPQNKVVFYDIVYKNIKINYDGNKIISNFAIQYKEELFDNNVCFTAYFVKIGDLENYFGHFEIDAKQTIYTDDIDNIPKLNEKANFYLDKNTKIVNGLIKN